MEITEIRIKLMEDSEDRLRAFCSITIDECFVVRDLKIIEGTSGPFVAMPSRKLASHCHRCGHKNHLRANYCNSCGAKLRVDASLGHESPQKLYADVAHPINSECREMIQNAVLAEFEAELARFNEPGYRSRYDDEFDYEEETPRGTDDAKAAPRGDRSGEREAGESTGKASPPRPHFLDRPDHASDRAARPGDEARDSDDDFGAGIFD